MGTIHASVSALPDPSNPPPRPQSKLETKQAPTSSTRWSRSSRFSRRILFLPRRVRNSQPTRPDLQLLLTELETRFSLILVISRPTDQSKNLTISFSVDTRSRKFSAPTPTAWTPLSSTINSMTASTQTSFDLLPPTRYQASETPPPPPV